MTNTRIVYEYRDRMKPYKQEMLIVAGVITLEQIIDTLDSRAFFIPNQVGLDDLQLRFDSDTLSSHLQVWHRMVSIEPTEEAPTVALTAAQLHAQFQDVTWDEEGALLQLWQHIHEEEDIQGNSHGKVIYLKRTKGRVPWDWHAWPVRLMREDPMTWYGYSIHQSLDEPPASYSKQVWSQVPPPQATVIVLNFAGALTQEIWSGLFEGWERFSILPSLHHLVIDSGFQYADEQGVHERVTLFLERIAHAYHWEERDWGRYADTVLALYPEREPLCTFLQQSLQKILGRTPTDARADLACRRGQEEANT